MQQKLSPPKKGTRPPASTPLHHAKQAHYTAALPTHTLPISQPGSSEEQEAEQIAQRIMQPAPDTLSSIARMRIFPTQFSVEHAARKADHASDHPIIQPSKHATTSSPESVAVEAVRDVRTGGRPLDSTTQAFMEAHFGENFDRVRIHSDERAAQSARMLDAQAYTLGEHIVFNARQYAPQTTKGRRLLAHELAHVMQQQHAPARAMPAIQRMKLPDEEKEKQKRKGGEPQISLPAFSSFMTVPFYPQQSLSPQGTFPSSPYIPQPQSLTNAPPTPEKGTVQDKPPVKSENAPPTPEKGTVQDEAPVKPEKEEIKEIPEIQEENKGFEQASMQSGSLIPIHSASNLHEALAQEGEDSRSNLATLNLLREGKENASAIIDTLKLLGPGQRALIRGDSDFAKALFAQMTDVQKVQAVDLLDYSLPDAYQLLAKSQVNSQLIGQWGKKRSNAQRDITDFLDMSWIVWATGTGASLPKGADIPPALGRDMLAWARQSNDVGKIKTLLERRFNLPLGEDEKWDKPGLISLWEQLDKLPTEHIISGRTFGSIVRGNTKEELPKEKEIIRGNTERSPFAASTIKVAYKPQAFNATDDGTYTSQGQLLENKNVLKATIVHEIGHSVDNDKLSAAGGALTAAPVLGQWKLHRNETDLLEELIQKGHWNPTEEEKGRLFTGLKTHKDIPVTSDDSAAFKSQATFINEGAKRNNPVKRGARRILGDRYYYQSYQYGGGDWQSYNASLRQTGVELSDYAYQDREDFFAELYAAFYTSDPPGSELAAANPALYKWFVENIDKGYSITKK